MPVLQHTRHEGFAQARAKGASLDDAYEDAGFAEGNGHSSRISKRPEIAERIAELRAAHAGEADASDQAVIAALVRLAKAAEELKSPAAFKKVRLMLLDARRLLREQAEDRACERRVMASL